MKVWILGSGSGGNAVLLESEGTRLLVDAGFGTRTLAARLKVAGVHPASIEACVITHEHTDHVKGAAAAAKLWGWSLFATAGTAKARELAGATVTTFTAGDTIALARMDVTTARTPHDASDPVGMIVTARGTGARTGIAYDIGHASDGVRTLCQDVDVLILESNHDDGMLWAGPYPPWLCKRISGGQGHLSNRAASVLAQESASPRLAHLVLAHLSEKNNTPEIARRGMARAVARTSFRGQVSVAAQDAVVGPLAPRGARFAMPEQLSLL